MNTFYGPDISSYQTITDWNDLNNGAAFIMIKASGNDDGNYIDSKYEDNMAHARSFGNDLPRIVYNFCGGTDAAADANYFVDNVGINLQVGEAYEFDCERGAAVTPAYALAALNQAESRLGWGGGVYVSQSRLVSEDWSPVATAGYFVHPADWGVSTSDNFNVGAFKTYYFQQYTDNATWPGISAPCDGDAFFGPAAINILKFGKPATVLQPPVVVASYPPPQAAPPVGGSPPPLPVASSGPTNAPSAATPTTTTTNSNTRTQVPSSPGTAIDVIVKPTSKSPVAPTVVATPSPTLKENSLDVLIRSVKTFVVAVPAIATAGGFDITHLSAPNNFKVATLIAVGSALLNTFIKVYQSAKN
jgi:hypothetical protein